MRTIKSLCSKRLSIGIPVLTKSYLLELGVILFIFVQALSFSVIFFTSTIYSAEKLSHYAASVLARNPEVSQLRVKIDINEENAQSLINAQRKPLLDIAQFARELNTVPLDVQACDETLSKILDEVKKRNYVVPNNSFGEISPAFAAQIYGPCNAIRREIYATNNHGPFGGYGSSSPMAFLKTGFISNKFLYGAALVAATRLNDQEAFKQIYYAIIDQKNSALYADFAAYVFKLFCRGDRTLSVPILGYANSYDPDFYRGLLFIDDNYSERVYFVKELQRVIPFSVPTYKAILACHGFSIEDFLLHKVIDPFDPCIVQNGVEYTAYEKFICRWAAYLFSRRYLERFAESSPDIPRLVARFEHLNDSYSCENLLRGYVQSWQYWRRMSPFRDIPTSLRRLHSAMIKALARYDTTGQLKPPLQRVIVGGISRTVIINRDIRALWPKNPQQGAIVISRSPQNIPVLEDLGVVPVDPFTWHHVDNGCTPYENRLMKCFNRKTDVNSMINSIIARNIRTPTYHSLNTDLSPNMCVDLLKGYVHGAICTPHFFEYNIHRIVLLKERVPDAASHVQSLIINAYRNSKEYSDDPEVDMRIARLKRIFSVSFLTN